MVNRTEQNPIFIVGMNGSGTTMLADCLDNSSELYAFPRETRMLPWLIEHLEDFGDLNKPQNLQRLLDTFCKFNVVRILLGEQKLTIADVAEPTLNGVVDAVYRTLAERQGKQRWVEKSPMNVQFMREIIAQMPTAKIIHMYRDGRDVAQSNQRRWLKNPYLTMYRWKEIVRQGRQDGHQLGNERYLEVRYEELTNAPEETMRAICAFVEIEYHPRLLQSSMPFVNTASANRMKERSGTIVATGNKWKKYYSEAQVARLEAIGGKCLAELGYEPSIVAGDRDPSPAFRKFWRVIDTCMQGYLTVRNHRRRNLLQKVSLRFVEGVRYISLQRY